MRRSLMVFLIGMLFVVLVFLFTQRPARQEAVFYPMGGIPFKVVAYGRTAHAFDRDMAAVRARVAELEATFNRFDPDSELSRLNREASVAPFLMSDEMARLMRRSRSWHLQSHKAFDPSIGPLVDLWKRAGKAGKRPSQEHLASARRIVGFDHVADVQGGRLLFAREGMSLDFGAIAKGVMLDEIAALLRERGVSRGVVDAGGNALAFGDGSFTFGIADPTVAGHEKLMGTIEVPAGAVVTSGNYERYQVIDGERYSHIIDPRTGLPLQNGPIAVTVVGGDGTDADALATTLMIMGREAGSGIIAGRDDVQVLFVEPGQGGYEVFASPPLISRLQLAGGWAEHLHPIEAIADDVSP